ncbi:MAG: RIO1 family regulatory kinase/ATPase [Nitrososphaeraceae archaeon]
MLSKRSLQQNDLLQTSINSDSPHLVDVISYPKFDNNEYFERLNEIRSLGVRYVVWGGRSVLGKIAIAGKGCVSLVLRAKFQDQSICALKIRRLDANRCSMEREAELHKIANSAGVGPKIFGNSKNIIIMEFIDGLSVIDWIKRDENVSDSRIVLKIIFEILEQCYLLDRAHLDHGQLSYLDYHVIVSGSYEATIVDFESSSTRRRTSNVTCAAQSLLLNGFISKRIDDILSLQNKKERLIYALKLYKSCQTRTNFDKILDLILE